MNTPTPNRKKLVYGGQKGLEGLTVTSQGS